MDPCDPKMNVSVARAAVINKLLVPSKIAAELKQSELCDLLRMCETKQLPDPPLMTRPKKVGNYMISIYIRSPLNVKETVALLSNDSSVGKIKKIAEKLEMFTNGDNLKQRILAKLASDGIPEPIRFLSKGQIQKNVVNRVNNGTNRVNNGTNRSNNGENRVNNGKNLGDNKFNLSTAKHHITIGRNNFKENQQQYAIGNRRNKRIMTGPLNYAREPSYQIASQRQQYQTDSNRSRYGYGGGSSNRLMRERMALNQEKQKLAIDMRKAQQNKELESKRREFNERVKKLTNMEKQLANKLKVAVPVPVPTTNMNKLKKNLVNAQKVIANLKTKPQNATVKAKLNNVRVQVLNMNNQVAVTQIATIPRVIEAAKQARSLPEDQREQAIQTVITNLKPVAVTNAQTQYVAKLEKLVANKKTSEAINSIEKETNVQFNSEKVKKMRELLGKAGGAIAGGAKAVAGGAAALYRKATKTLTIQEKRALLNKLLGNNSISNTNKVKISAVRNLTNFPKMKSVNNVTAYYNKLVKNKNYTEIAAIAEQYGGVKGSLANLRKIGVNKKNKRLTELINRFQGSNGGVARISKNTNIKRYDILQQAIVEIEKKGNAKLSKDELRKLFKSFGIETTVIDEILEYISDDSASVNEVVAASQQFMATLSSLNSRQGSKEVPVSPSLTNPEQPTNVPKEAINKFVNAGFNIKQMFINNNNVRKKAYITLALKVHPNKGGIKELFQALGEIYTRSNADVLQKMGEYYEGAKRLKNSIISGKPEGTEAMYQSKLQVASLINKKTAASVQSQLLDKINQQGGPTPAMYGVAEMNLNKILRRFKPSNSCPSMGDPKVIAALRVSTGNTGLNNLRRRLANVCNNKVPGEPDENFGSGPTHNSVRAGVLMNVLKNLGPEKYRENPQYKSLSAGNKNNMNKALAVIFGPRAAAGSLQRLQEALSKLKANGSAKLQRRLANAEKKASGIQPNVSRSNSETQTNVNQTVVNQVTRQMSLYRNMMQKSTVPKKSVKKMWNIQEARFMANKEQLKTNHNTAIENLKKMSTELEKQIEELKKKPETREFGTGTNNLQVLKSLKENIKGLPANLQNRILKLVPADAINNKEARKVLEKIKKVLELIKLYPNGINTLELSNFNKLNEKIKTLQKANASRLTKAKEKEEANRVAKEKEEANRVAKEKEEAEAARKKKLKKQLSNSWNQNNTVGTLKNSLFNDLQSYINGGKKLNTNVSKYAKNNNPTQHPKLLERLNKFIESSGSNGLNLEPVKKLQSQLKDLVNAEAKELTEAKKQEKAKANLAKQAKKKAIQNEKKSKENARKQKVRNWFNGLTNDERNLIKGIVKLNTNELNFAEKSLIRIIKDKKLSSIKKIQPRNIRSSDNIISYLENENKNVQKAAMIRVLHPNSAKEARYMFTNKRDPRLLRLEYLSGQLTKGLNASRIAQLLKMKEAPLTLKMAMGAVPEQKKPRGGPIQPSPTTNSNIENEGNTKIVKKRVAAEKKRKTRVPATKNQLKGPHTQYFQRLSSHPPTN